MPACMSSCHVNVSLVPVLTGLPLYSSICTCQPPSLSRLMAILLPTPCAVAVHLVSSPTDQPVHTVEPLQAVILICVIGLAAILGIWSFSRSSNKQSVSSSGDRGSSSWRDRAGQSGGTGIGSSTSASTLQRGNSSSAASSHGTYVLRTGQGISRGSALNNL
jgi:hypothetical protein